VSSPPNIAFAVSRAALHVGLTDDQVTRLLGTLDMLGYGLQPLPVCERCGGTEVVDGGLACPECLPMTAKARAPVVPDDIPTDPGPDDSPVARARYILAHPDVQVDTHGYHRVIAGLVAQIEGGAT